MYLETARAIDNFFTNSILNNKVKTGLVKTDVSDHFPVFALSDFGILKE